jgi:hypothetical protein
MHLMEEAKPVSVTALAAVLLAALVIGCGGPSEAAPLGKAQFVKQADAICLTAQAEREGQRKEVSEQASESDAMQILLEPIESMTVELGDLGAPVGQAKQVEAIISAYEEGAAKLAAGPGGPDSASAFEKANELAASYGLTGCAI